MLNKIQPSLEPLMGLDYLFADTETELDNLQSFSVNEWHQDSDLELPWWFSAENPPAL